MALLIHQPLQGAVGRPAVRRLCGRSRLCQSGFFEKNLLKVTAEDVPRSTATYDRQLAIVDEPLNILPATAKDAPGFVKIQRPVGIDGPVQVPNRIGQRLDRFLYRFHNNLAQTTIAMARIVDTRWSSAVGMVDARWWIAAAWLYA